MIADELARLASWRPADTKTSDRPQCVAGRFGGMASEEKDGGEGSGSAKRFKPYRSILKFSSAPSRLATASTATTSSEELSTEATPKPIRKVGPPWRRRVGAAFLALQTEDEQIDFELDEVEEERYIDILERVFDHFSSTPIGAEQEIIDMSPSSGDMIPEMSWSIDSERRRGFVEGDKEVAYESTDKAVRTGSSTSRTA